MNTNKIPNKRDELTNNWQRAALPPANIHLPSEFVQQCESIAERYLTSWTEGYTAASAFCCEQGMTIKLANGGQRWRPEYQDEEARLEWAQSLTV